MRFKRYSFKFSTKISMDEKGTIEREPKKHRQQNKCTLGSAGGLCLENC